MNHTACVALCVLLLPGLAAAQTRPTAIFRDGERVLFQGDSITDGGRGRGGDPNHVFGQDYVYMIAGRYGVDHPQQGVVFLNRGIGSSQLADMAKRWKADTLDAQPDVVSIMIGVNDVLLNLRKNQPVSIETFEKTYDGLLAQTVAARPGVRLVLCEPFCLPGKQVDSKPADWAKNIGDIRAVLGRLGEKYHAPVVRLQDEFDAAVKRAPVTHWIWDGIHPTYAGHQLIADAWVKTYQQFYGTAATTRP